MDWMRAAWCCSRRPKAFPWTLTEQLSAAEVKARLPECDAMVVRSRTRVTAELLENTPRLKVIGRAGTGVDNIDVKSASARGILVMNTPGANAMAAAEHTLALMLALARYVPRPTSPCMKDTGTRSVCGDRALRSDSGGKLVWGGLAPLWRTERWE